MAVRQLLRVCPMSLQHITVAELPRGMAIARALSAKFKEYGQLKVTPPFRYTVLHVKGGGTGGSRGSLASPILDLRTQTLRASCG